MWPAMGRPEQKKKAGAAATAEYSLPDVWHSLHTVYSCALLHKLSKLLLCDNSLDVCSALPQKVRKRHGDLAAGGECSACRPRRSQHSPSFLKQ
jgi:hypothetical protein